MTMEREGGGEDETKIEPDEVVIKGRNRKFEWKEKPARKWEQGGKTTRKWENNRTWVFKYPNLISGHQLLASSVFLYLLNWTFLWSAVYLPVFIIDWDVFWWNFPLLNLRPSLIYKFIWVSNIVPYHLSHLFSLHTVIKYFFSPSLPTSTFLSYWSFTVNIPTALFFGHRVL